MKTRCLCACIVAAVCVAVPTVAEQRVATATSEAVRPEKLGEPAIAPGDAIGRGFLNMCCCWIELPRNIVRDNIVVCPVAGVFTGTAKGAFFTIARALAGTADMLTLGMTRNLTYNEQSFPEYIWDAPWK